MQRGHHVVEVGERFAHAHHDHVGDRMPSMLDPGGDYTVGEQRAIGVPQLSDDLADFEIAVEALFAGRAERTVERATCLRRNAQRAAIGFRNVHRLDRVRFAHVEQPLAGAVGCSRVAHDRGRPDLGVARQRFARRLGEIAHHFDAIRQPVVHPA